MKMDDIKKKAKEVGIKVIAAKPKKLDLIREIQAKEGNFPCFGSADLYCDQETCIFREDCLNKDY